MSIEHLASIIKPPKLPSEVGSREKFDSIGATLGMKLPEDLYRFSATYGTGRLCDGFIQVYNFASEHYLDILAAERRRMLLFVDSIPYPIFPDTCGLFPWGRDQNGGTMFFLTDGLPDAWPIILMSRDVEFERWELTMSDFLTKAITHEITCILWDIKFPKRQLKFIK